MIDHVSVTVSDLGRSIAFYSAVLGALGHRIVASNEQTAGFGKDYAELWVNLRAGAARQPEDTGAHVCMRARDTAAVHGFHAAALEHGGTDDGPPGPRPEYAPSYYAAFVRDPDGNRIEAVTFIKQAEKES